LKIDEQLKDKRFSAKEVGLIKRRHQKVNRISANQLKNHQTRSISKPP
jgi:hypothetical protein